jgi:hypothetical protein
MPSQQRSTDFRKGRRWKPLAPSDCWHDTTFLFCPKKYCFNHRVYDRCYKIEKEDA